MRFTLAPTVLLLAAVRGAHSILRGARREEALGDVLADFDDSLWSGSDVDGVALQHLHAEMYGNVKLGRVSQGVAEKSVHVLGLQDTGTNLLFSMLLINFGSRLAFYDSAYSGQTQFRRGVWKHSNIKVLHDYNKSAFDDMGKERVVALMMVRDPMSWLQSVNKAPYELHPCVGGKDWLTRPCFHKVPAGYHQAPGQQFANLEAVWNSWTGAYEAHSENGFVDGLIVRYEDLVLEPARTMDAIGAKLGMGAPAEGWNLMNKSAKTHGDSHGRMEAIEKIVSKSYLNEFVGSEIKDSCARFDPELLKRYAFGNCSATALKEVSHEAQSREDAEGKTLEEGATEAGISLQHYCASASLSGKQGLSSHSAHAILTARAEALVWLYNESQPTPTAIRTKLATLSGFEAAVRTGEFHSAFGVGKSDFPMAAALCAQEFVSDSPRNGRTVRAVKAKERLLALCGRVSAEPDQEYSPIARAATLEALKWLLANPGAGRDPIERIHTRIKQAHKALQEHRPQKVRRLLIPQDSFPVTRALLKESGTLSKEISEFRKPTPQSVRQIDQPPRRIIRMPIEGGHLRV